MQQGGRNEGETLHEHIREGFMGKSGIYCIKNLKDGKMYIGQSKNLSKRFSDHLYELRNNRHFNDHLQRAWNKYGEESFDIYTIKLCSKDELDYYETYYIDLYQTMNVKNGYNKDSGGNKYKTRNKESCDKMRKYWLERGGINDGLLKATIEAQKPVVQYDKNGNRICNFNSIMDASYKTGIGFKQISAVCTGFHKTASGYIWRFEGDNFNKFSIDREIKTKKKVIQCTMNDEFINEFNSVSDAGRYTGVDYRNISMVCNGKRKSTGGYIWKFAS